MCNSFNYFHIVSSLVLCKKFIHSLDLFLFKKQFVGKHLSVSGICCNVLCFPFMESLSFTNIFMNYNNFTLHADSYEDDHDFGLQRF